MKKIISLILCVVFALIACTIPVAANGYIGGDILSLSASRHTVLYAADGRTITVANSAVDLYLSVGWYADPVVTLYNSAGETTVVYKSDAHLHIAAGWYESPEQIPVPKPSSNKKAVALTYDDGPSKHTSRVLDCLEAYGAKATFFVVGTNVVRFGDTLRRAHSLGMEIGNHTVNHPNLKNLSSDKVSSELNTNADYIEAAIGVRPGLIRPPYGSYSKTTLSIAKQPFILWSIDTLDWKTRDAQSTVDSVLSSVKDGDIILMHDLYEPTAAATEIIVPKLIEMGFDLVTVSELAERKGVTMEVSSYSKFK